MPQFEGHGANGAFAPETARPGPGRPGRRTAAFLAAAAALLACIALLLPAAPAQAAPAGLAYTVAFSGVSDAATLSLLKEVSKSLALASEPPETALLLMRRAKEDEAAFAKVFSSLGRYAATIRSELDQSGTPAKLTFVVDPGPQFTLGQVIFRVPEGCPVTEVAWPEPAALGLAVGMPAEAKAIVTAQDKLEAAFKHTGHPYAKVTDRKVVANFADHTVTVTWTVDPGFKAAFGQTEFTGLVAVKAAFLLASVPWKEGLEYDADLLEVYRRRLTGLGLFTMVEVAPGADMDASGRVPIVVTVTERKHRTIKGGVDYKTDEGPGANLSWEHRNLFGGGEKLSLTASASPIERLGEAAFEKPDFIRPDQLFKAKARLTDEDKKAYKGQSGTVSGSLRRRFNSLFSAEAGLGYRASRIERDESRPWEDDTRYGFVYLPLEATLDTRDDLLDPSKGILASLALAPYWGTLAHGPNFLRPEANLAGYVKVADKPSLVLANRVNAAADMGADRNAIPPDLRLYAGGSGSIRGYPYQTVGPMRSKTPVGGRSVFTFSSELRWRVTELIGVVPFLDGGTAFAEQYPPYRQPILLGAGLGLRVYTPIGPVRLDVATPVTRRKDIDDIAQFYLSLGQSF